MYKKQYLLNYLFLNKYTKYLTDGAMIAGGCFKHLMNNETPKDIDIFFENKFFFEQAELHYKADTHFKFLYENENAIAFRENETNLQIELVKSIYGSLEEILNQFDFTIVKIGIERNKLQPEIPLKEFRLIYHEDFFEHLFTKRLVIDPDIKLPFPIGTFNRSFRYAKYGYELCGESKLALIKDINSLDSNTDFESELGSLLYSGFD